MGSIWHRALLAALIAVPLLLLSRGAGAADNKGWKLLESISRIEQADCPSFGALALTPMLSDPARANVLAKLTWRTALYHRRRFLELTTKDVSGEQDSTERRAAQQALIDMTSGVAGWTYIVWSKAQTLDPAFPPGATAAHPLQELAGQVDELVQMARPVLRDPDGTAMLQPLLQRHQDCLVSLQNEVLARNLPTRKPDPAGLKRLYAQHTAIGVAFSAPGVAIPAAAADLFGPLLPASSFTAPDRRLSAGERHRRLRRQLVQRVEGDFKIVRPEPTPQPPKPVKPAPKPKPKPAPAVTAGQQMDVSRSFFNAVMSYNHGGAVRYLQPRVRYRADKNPGTYDRDDVVTTMIDGFRRQKAKIRIKQVAPAGANRVRVVAGAFIGSQTIILIFKGDKIAEIHT